MIDYDNEYEYEYEENSQKRGPSNPLAISTNSRYHSLFGIFEATKADLRCLWIG